MLVYQRVYKPMMFFWSPILRQEFVLCPPLECQKLRLVCTRNAMAALKPTELLPRRGEDSMGLDGTEFAVMYVLFSGGCFKLHFHDICEDDEIETFFSGGNTWQKVMRIVLFP